VESDSDGVGEVGRDGFGGFDLVMRLLGLLVPGLDTPFELDAFEVLGRGGEKAGRLRFAAAAAAADGGPIAGIT
jgi:hypothetical protein